MRKMMNYVGVGLAIMVVLTFLLGLTDEAFRKTGIWYKDIFGSVKYYVLWVLPYWWVIILIGSVVFGIISFGIQMGISRLRE